MLTIVAHFPNVGNISYLQILQRQKHNFEHTLTDITIQKKSKTLARTRTDTTTKNTQKQSQEIKLVFKKRHSPMRGKDDGGAKSSNFAHYVPQRAARSHI